MISLEGITAVRRRIAEIEQTFGDPRQMLQGADFASNLRNEIEKMHNAAKVTRTEATDKTATAAEAAEHAVSAAATLPELPNVSGAQLSQPNDGFDRQISDGATIGEQKTFGDYLHLPDVDKTESAPTVYDDAAKTNSFGDDVTRFLNEAAARYGVDNRLVNAIAQVESAGNQNAVSSAGAIGVMQLMPDTAYSLGVNPYDLEDNIDGGVRYVGNLLSEFGGDVKKAIAAYNAGPNAVKQYGGVPPYSETQNYVNRVLDIYQ